jgi:hypothetical protein
MVRIVTIQGAYDLVVWLCPHCIEATRVGGLWSIRKVEPLTPWPLECINAGTGQCTSAWVEPPPRTAPAAEAPALEQARFEPEAPALAERQKPAPPAKPQHPIGRDRRLRRLMDLRKAGVPLADALEQVEKETAQ